MLLQAFNHEGIVVALQVGSTFQQVSEGQYTERIAPYLMQAAPFAGVDRLPFQQALQNAVRDKRKVPCCLWHLAEIPVLLQRPPDLCSQQPVLAQPAQILRS